MSFTPPPNLLATLGAYAGIRRVQLRGRNAAISNAAETVWAAGATYAQLTTAAALEAVSSSAMTQQQAQAQEPLPLSLSMVTTPNPP